MSDGNFPNYRPRPQGQFPQRPQAQNPPGRADASQMPPRQPTKKNGCLKVFGIGVAALFGVGMLSTCMGGDDGRSTAEAPSATATKTRSTPTPTHNSESASAPTTQAAPPPPPPPSTQAPTTQSRTASQQQAIRKAESYLDYTAFSRKGLIEQLEYEKFSTADATFAVDNIEVDWNEQAAKKAKSYLEFSSFSRQGLIEQLEFEGFTSEQAEYGASAVGL